METLHNFVGSLIMCVQGFFMSKAFFADRMCQAEIYVLDDTCKPVIGRDLMIGLDMQVDCGAKWVQCAKDSSEAALVVGSSGTEAGNAPVAPYSGTFPGFQHHIKLDIRVSGFHFFGVGISAILSQEQGGWEVTVACTSHTLQLAKQNYSTTEQEALACVWVGGADKFECYLWGAISLSAQITTQ